MNVTVECAEGLAPSAQYRALALIAALHRQVGARWSNDHPSTAALSLLRAEDQLALLRATGDTAVFDEPKAAPKQSHPHAPRRVWLATLGMLDHALPSDSVGVVLDGAPPSYDVAVRSGLERVFAFGSSHRNEEGAGLHALPRPVDPLFLAPHNARDAQAHRVLVGLCVCGDESALIEAVSRAASHGPSDVELLCPHRRQTVHRAGVKRWGAMGPAARYELWQRATQCVAHDCVDVDNDAFCDEAQAMGVVVSRLSSFFSAQDAKGERHEEAALQAPPGAAAYVDFGQVADLVLQAPEADDSVPLCTPARPHARIVFAKSFAALAESAGDADAARDYAVVVCGDQALDEHASGHLAARFGYANVFANLAAHAALASSLMQQSIMGRIERQRFEPSYMTGAMQDDGLLHGAIAWLQQRDERVLHVVFAPGRPLQSERLARRFAAASAPNGPLLRVVLDAKEPQANERISGATIGVEVAGRDLARAMMHGLSARSRALFWPRLQGDTSEQRTILPTQPGWLPRAEADQRVVQACQPKLKGDDVRLALQRDEVDAFFLPSGPFLDGIVTARNAWARFGVPVVGVLHSIHGLSVSMQLWQLQTLSPLSFFDGFISPTECGKQALLNQWDAVSRMHPASAAPVSAPVIDVVPYGIHTAFYGGRDRLACRVAAGISADALLFVQVGRMHRTEKGDLAPLLLAFREVVAAHPQAYLVLVGKPRAPEEVERTRVLVEQLGLGSSVDIREKVSAEQKAQLLCAADAFVSVSDNVQETYGLVLLEAMAAGTPVIVPAWNGYRELVQDGQTGWLVDCQWGQIPAERLFVQQITAGNNGYGWRDLHETVVVDVQELVRAMLIVAEHPERAREVGARAQTWVRQQHDSLRQGERLCQVLADRSRAARQAASTWQRPPVWRENVVQAFRHYPSTTLSADVAVVATARGQDSALRAAIFEAMHLSSETEQAAIIGLIERASQAPTTLFELNDPRLDLSRLLRCMKYGLVAPVL